MTREKVFLTGGSGRIGRRVERKLLERGYAVRSLVHRGRPKGPVHPDLELVQGDILDQEGLKRLVPGCSFVVHLAAAWDLFPPAVYEKENNQLFESVVRGTYNMLEASCAATGLKCFLYASTDAAYATGPRKFDAPITEDTELSGLPWLIVRICWCLDVDEILRIFQYDFWEGGLSTEDRARLASILSGGRGVFAPLMPDGSSGVDHVSDPEDVAEGIVLGVVNHAAGLRGVYNLAGPSNFRYRELIEKLAVDLGVPWGSAPVKGIEPYELSTERARRVLGYAPQYPIERMLANAVRYAKERER
jgi:nucleoside-diphosphate-sugar epimerase